jgi:hypothetical protein
VPGRLSAVIADQRGHELVALLDEPLQQAQDAGGVVGDRSAAQLAGRYVGVCQRVQVRELVQDIGGRQADPAGDLAWPGALRRRPLQGEEPVLWDGHVE